MTSGNKHKFSYGKKRYDIFHYVKVGLLLKGSIDLISMIPGVNKKQVFNLIDEVQLKLGADILNEYIIKDTELIGYRIERVLDRAVKEYERNS
jgi:hypothetical protein